MITVATPAQANYRRLDDALIVGTLERLRARIEERFPASGLTRVASELIALAHESAADIAYLRRPNWVLRSVILLIIATMLALVLFVAFTIHVPTATTVLSDFVQAVEAAINDVIFLGVAVYFLFTIEGRLKRSRALRALHEFRSVVHIVDMHQLTKDPERLMAGHTDTPSSPARSMTAAELGRYLDYCSEMLSLTSKLAALYVQHLNDPVVLGAVSEIETLASGLSNKIWQKITLLEPLSQRQRALPANA